MKPTTEEIPPGVDPVLWTTDNVDEDHLAAFARALKQPDYHEADDGALSPASPRSPEYSPEDAPEWKIGVEKLTATSDFAPIHQRVTRRRSKSQGFGLTYHLIRWPLLAFLFLIISIEFGAYVLTRQAVNVLEWSFAWRGHKRLLRKNLRKAKTYTEWVAAARALDEYFGFNDWKESDDDSYFDAALVRRVRSTLSRLRAAKDTRGVMDALSVCVRANFAGTESVKMYSETFFGTKRLIESHIREIVASLDYVRSATDITLEEKRTFFRGVNKNYGSSALCLSGGASFGYYHLGVAKAFLDADLLPRVITGTSAGGLIAALVCTHTDGELKQLLRPELADKVTACEDPLPVWIRRWWETGARFSALEWARKAMFFTRGSLTFKEAYELTGRALNVSVVPADRHSPTILLNHLTAPNCIIWSAIIASAAVPGILNPVVLMSKDRDGSIKPHHLGGSRFKDGSLREDIPLGSLHTQFNCNFSIVSQTNPHIHLFFFAPRGSVGRPVAHRKGRGWRGGFILSALESYIKLDLSKHFKVIRDLDLMPQLLQSDWSGVFLQRFSGDVTLTPRSVVRDWFHLLDDPDRKQLERMLSVGQRVTWPSLHMSSNRMKIERAILRGRAEVRLALHRDRPTTDVNATPMETETHPVPIESDADAAIAMRARQRRSRTDLKSEGIRRRKGLRREALEHQMLTIHPPQHTALSQEPSQLSPGPRSPMAYVGDTFRQMRSFAGFRNGQPAPRSMSRMSIARWFAAEDPSSSEDDDDTPDVQQWSLDGYQRDHEGQGFDSESDPEAHHTFGGHPDTAIFDNASSRPNSASSAASTNHNGPSQDA